MLPPVDPAVLEANPQLAALYHDLTTNRLHHLDGSTIDPERDARCAKAWNTLARFKHRPAKLHLLRNALLTIAHRFSPSSSSSSITAPTASILPYEPSVGPGPATDSDHHHVTSTTPALPDELQTAISVLMTSTCIPDPDLRAQATELLQSDAQYYLDNLDTIVPALTAYLDEATPHIAALLHQKPPHELGLYHHHHHPPASSVPTTSPVAGGTSSQPRDRAPLPLPRQHLNQPSGPSCCSQVDPVAVANLLSSRPTNFYTLLNFRSAPRIDPSLDPVTIPPAPVSLRAAHTDLVVELIGILEQAVHGIVADHNQAKAEHLATLARAMELKSKLQLATVLENEGVINRAAEKELANDNRRAGREDGDDGDGDGDQHTGFFPFASPEKEKVPKINREGPMTKLGTLLGEYMRLLEQGSDRPTGW